MPQSGATTMRSAGNMFERAADARGPARNYDTFADATLKKLITEIAGTTPRHAELIRIALSYGFSTPPPNQDAGTRPDPIPRVPDPL